MYRCGRLLSALVVSSAWFLSSMSLAGAQICTPGSSAANDFADAVQVLQQSSTYPPSSLAPPIPSDIYTSLKNLKSTSSTYHEIWNEFHDALNLASPKFRKALCALSGVYIDQRACSSGGGSACVGNNSWGFRNPNDTSKKYIGLSGRLWDSGAAPVLSKHETNTLNQVLAVLQMPWPNGAKPPEFQTATSSGGSNVDTSAATVLAMLAHEYGHILWADIVKIQGGVSYIYDPKDFCKSGNDHFFRGSWSSVSQPPSFIDFAQEYAMDQHANSPTISELRSIIQQVASDPPGSTQWTTDILAAAQKLGYFYEKEYADNDTPVIPGGVWASLFGAVSPEEDFVESFRFYILTLGSSVNVTSMPLWIYVDQSTTPAYKPDVFADFSKQPGGGQHARKDKLVKKIKKCLDNAF